MIQQKTGNEHFTFDEMPQGFLLQDFWRWQSSDLLNNTLRGILAEFLVAKALGMDTSEPRVEWDSYDLLFNDRVRIEVKSSAYIQSWAQKADSVLRFSIRPTRAWCAEHGYSDELLRQSDMYIFCVFAERDRTQADPMTLDKWEFYPVLTSELNDLAKAQQTAALSTLVRLCPEPYDFSILRDAVTWLLSDRTDAEARHRIDAHNALRRKTKTE